MRCHDTPSYLILHSSGPVCPSREQLTRHTDSRHRQLSEEVRRRLGARRIFRHHGLKLWVIERLLEMRGRFPDGVIDKNAASRNATMQLGADEAGLPLHDLSVCRPRVEERIDLLRLHCEGIDQDHGSALVLQLCQQRHLLIHLNELWHARNLLFLSVLRSLSIRTGSRKTGE